MPTRKQPPVTKAKLMKHLKEDTWVRMSKTKYGAGLRAIRDIPKNTFIFKTPLSICPADKWIVLQEKEIRTLPKSVQDLVYDFGAMSGGPMAKSGPAVVPLDGFNSMDITNFMNHNDNPNCDSYTDLKNQPCIMTFKTKRKVKSGEMMTYKYA